MSDQSLNQMSMALQARLKSDTLKFLKDCRSRYRLMTVLCFGGSLTLLGFLWLIWGQGLFPRILIGLCILTLMVGAVMNLIFVRSNSKMIKECEQL